jgi:hypothetical protein
MRLRVLAIFSSIIHSASRAIAMSSMIKKSIDAIEGDSIMKEQFLGKNLMRLRIQRFDFALLILVLAAAMAIPSAFAAKGSTFTGTVSDSMCGAKHAMGGDDAGCTRTCVSKGSKYALVVGDKVYTLETSDKAALGTLDKQAGAKVTVTGTAKDDVITVSSVKAAQ